MQKLNCEPPTGGPDVYPNFKYPCWKQNNHSLFVLTTKICCWTNHQQPSTIPPKKIFTRTIRGPHCSPSAPLWATCWASRHSPIPRASHGASSKTSSKEPKERRWLARQKRVCRFLLGMAIKTNTTVCRFFFGGTNDQKMCKVKKTVKAYAEYHRNLSMVKYTVPILTL